MNHRINTYIRHINKNYGKTGVLSYRIKWNPFFGGVRNFWGLRKQSDPTQHHHISFELPWEKRKYEPQISAEN